MIRHLLLRLLFTIPAIWLILTMVFLLVHIVPGDPVQQMLGFGARAEDLDRLRHALGLDQPLHVQYGRYLAGLAMVLVDGTAVGGFNVMLPPYMGSTYHGAMELLPRLLLGGILINTATWWGQLAIDVNNAACGVFGAGPPATIDDTIWRSMLPSGLLVVLIYVVMGLLLLLQQLMRLALVDVLLVIAPLAALCWILPQTYGWARLWGSLFVGTVFAQFVQVLALRLGFNLATDFPPGTAAGLIQPLLGIAVLALVLKIPGLMRGGAAGGNFVGSLLGTAVGAAVGGGTSRLIGASLAARGGGAVASGSNRASASQLSLPMAVGVGQSQGPRGGSASQQLTLPVAVPHPARGEA